MHQFEVELFTAEIKFSREVICSPRKKIEQTSTAVVKTLSNLQLESNNFIEIFVKVTKETIHDKVLFISLVENTEH